MMKPIFFSVALFGALTVWPSGASAAEPQASTGAAMVNVTRQISPFFPVRLLRQGVTHGEAVVEVSLDQSGKLADYLVARYTHPEFADAAVDALQHWEFKLNQPVGVVMEIVFLFRLNGVLAVERFGGEGTLRHSVSAGEYVYQPCAPGELDHPPKPSHVVPPSYPAELEQQGVEGVVSINFYIDEKGRARLPVPVTQENRLLASLATAAVEQWQFEPPTRAGKPVLVHATQRFSFVAKK